MGGFAALVDYNLGLDLLLVLELLVDGTALACGDFE